jgi:hypothetical protein
MNDCLLCKYVGTHVDWQKLEGKPNSSMTEKSGFGTLDPIKLRQQMVINGDYGVYTSEVRSVEVVEEGLKVVTKNSVYLVRPWQK